MLLVRQEEREMLHKLNFPRAIALQMCRSWKQGCLTPESERITMRNASELTVSA